ncbi:MAG: hypothetical protein M3393_02200 [Actinomycetota bacterium]|nr:hypothetical protein [Actinomycetota bacterium]
MPEGDTVWRTARNLDRALSGSVLLESQFRVPAYATLDLSGRRVIETVARGKHLLTRFDGGSGGGSGITVHTHLKMEGSWHLNRRGSRWRRPAHQARVVLRTEDWTGVGFSLGIVEVIGTTQEKDVVGHLGPDLLGPDWDADEAVRRLGERPQRPVSEALLDQRNLAGVGNMYQSELCFLLGLNPWLPVGSVPDLRKLVTRAKAVLEANKERTAQTTTGDLRRGYQHWVYRRGRQPCRRCGTPVDAQTSKEDGSTREGTRDAGRERDTYWCPRCQPDRPHRDPG